MYKRQVPLTVTAALSPAASATPAATPSQSPAGACPVAADIPDEDALEIFCKANPMHILTLAASDPVYKRAYACFKRGVQNPRTSQVVKDAFVGNAKQLFADWLQDFRSFDGVVLRLTQTQQNALETDDECAFRTQGQMEADGRWGSADDVLAICQEKLASGHWRPNPDAPRNDKLRPAIVNALLAQ